MKPPQVQPCKSYRGVAIGLGVALAILIITFIILVIARVITFGGRTPNPPTPPSRRTRCVDYSVNPDTCTGAFNQAGQACVIRNGACTENASPTPPPTTCANAAAVSAWFQANPNIPVTIEPAGGAALKHLVSYSGLDTMYGLPQITVNASRTNNAGQEDLNVRTVHGWNRGGNATANSTFDRIIPPSTGASKPIDMVNVTGGSGFYTISSIINTNKTPPNVRDWTATTTNGLYVSQINSAGVTTGTIPAFQLS